MYIHRANLRLGQYNACMPSLWPILYTFILFGGSKELQQAKTYRAGGNWRVNLVMHRDYYYCCYTYNTTGLTTNMFMITLKASTRSCKTDWEKPRGYTLIERSISRNNSGTLVTDVYAKANKFISSDVIYTAHNSKGIAIYTAVQQTTIERIEMITFPEKFTLRGGDGRTGKQIVMNDGSI